MTPLVPSTPAKCLRGEVAGLRSETRFFRLSDCKFCDAGLELHSSSNRLDRTWKFCQEPVAVVRHDAAAVFDNCRDDRVR